MKLTLIRHGITEGNARLLYYGAADIPLLPEGEECRSAKVGKLRVFPMPMATNRADADGLSLQHQLQVYLRH